MFPTQTYINRRAILKSNIESGLILLFGNEESPMNYADNTFRFRQDSSFLYYFGLNIAGLMGVIDLDSNQEIIFGTELTIDDIVWMGTHPTLALQSESAGVQSTGTIPQLEKLLSDAKQKGRKIHFLPPYRAENKIKLFKWIGVHPEEAVRESSVELRIAIAEQRNTKSAAEIAEIEKSVNVSVDMHHAAMRITKPGMSEYEIAAEVHRVALMNNCDLSFPIIATKNGQTLHNHFHGNKLKSGDLFLLDAGAENAMGYAGDLSSTFPVDAKFTSRQKDIYNISLAAHNKAISMLRPTIPFKEVYYETCREIMRGMKDMGFVKGNIEDAVMAGATAMFFQCGLGHMMGLDVHDMEDIGEVYVGYGGQPKETQFGIKSLRLGRPLQPGYVLTIEPGIYFIPELIDLWKSEKRFAEFLHYDKIEQYRDFGGIRNEEDVLITEDGYRILGKPKAKSVEDVENERAKAFE